jgi:putative endonuclease
MSLKKGRHGEAIARKYLNKLGYKILTSNWYSRYGEIDIIALSSESSLVFVEVKNYKRNSFLDPKESISPKKIKNLSNTAELYLAECENNYESIRFDLIIVRSNLVLEHLINFI